MPVPLSPVLLLWLNRLTDLGDSAVLLPLSAIIALYLWSSGSRPAARFWILAIGGTGFLLGVFKLLFLSCGVAFLPVSMVHALHSPSGHTGMSVAVYGGLFCLFYSRLHRLFRLPLLVLTVLLIAGIAVSRVLLGCHTPAEVVAGFITGCPALWFVRLRHAHAISRISPLIIAPTVIIILSLFYGRHLHIEEWLQLQAGRLSETIASCR